MVPYYAKIQSNAPRNSGSPTLKTFLTGKIWPKKYFCVTKMFWPEQKSFLHKKYFFSRNNHFAQKYFWPKKSLLRKKLDHIIWFIYLVIIGSLARYIASTATARAQANLGAFICATGENNLWLIMWTYSYGTKSTFFWDLFWFNYITLFLEPYSSSRTKSTKTTKILFSVSYV